MHAYKSMLIPKEDIQYMISDYVYYTLILEHVDI